MQVLRRLDASGWRHHRVPANDDVSRQLRANRTTPYCSGIDGISRHVRLKQGCCRAFCYGFLHRRCVGSIDRNSSALCHLRTEAGAPVGYDPAAGVVEPGSVPTLA
jgi:hypothetical protein